MLLEGEAFLFDIQVHSLSPSVYVITMPTCISSMYELFVFPALPLNLVMYLCMRLYFTLSPPLSLSLSLSLFLSLSFSALFRYIFLTLSISLSLSFSLPLSLSHSYSPTLYHIPSLNFSHILLLSHTLLNCVNFFIPSSLRFYVPKPLWASSRPQHPSRR